MIICHLNIYHLWIWGSRSEEGVPSYQSFIMEIMCVSEQKNKPWSLQDTQLQKYSFRAGRGRGLSVLGVSNELELPFWDLALEDSGKVERSTPLAASRVVYVKEASHSTACCLLMGCPRTSTRKKKGLQTKLVSHNREHYKITVRRGLRFPAISKDKAKWHFWDPLKYHTVSRLYRSLDSYQHASEGKWSLLGKS